MDEEAGKRRIEELIGEFGCIPRMSDPTVVIGFDAAAVAVAIDKEADRANEYGWSKITLHMDIPDARLLAAALRGGRRRSAKSRFVAWASGVIRWRGRQWPA